MDKVFQTSQPPILDVQHEDTWKGYLFTGTVFSIIYDAVCQCNHCKIRVPSIKRDFFLFKDRIRNS